MDLDIYVRYQIQQTYQQVQQRRFIIRFQSSCRLPILFRLLLQLIRHFLHFFFCHLMRNLVQLLDILNLHYFSHYSFLSLGLPLEVVENHLNAVVMITDDLVSLPGGEVVVDLNHLLDLLEGHAWKLHGFEARQLEGQVAGAGYDYVVIRVFLPNKFDLFQRQLIQSFHEEDLSSFLSSQSQHELHVKSRLLDGLEQLLLLMTRALIPLDHHWSSLSRMDVGLMFYEVFNPSLIISNQNRVIVPHELGADVLVGRRLEYLVDLDIIRDVLILSEVDDEGDEEVDHDDEEDDCGSHNDGQLHPIDIMSAANQQFSNLVACELAIEQQNQSHCSMILAA